MQKKKNVITGEEIEMTVAEQMDMAQIVKAIDGDSKAYKEVIDRLEGTAQQTVTQNISIDTEKKITTSMDGNEISLKINTDNPHELPSEELPSTE